MEVHVRRISAAIKSAKACIFVENTRLVRVRRKLFFFAPLLDREGSSARKNQDGKREKRARNERGSRRVRFDKRLTAAEKRTIKSSIKPIVGGPRGNYGRERYSNVSEGNLLRQDLRKERSATRLIGSPLEFLLL